MRSVPRVLFAPADLCRNTGGISVLSRLAFNTLRDLHNRGEIALELCVLNELPGDANGLGVRADGIAARWCGASRTRFAWSVFTSRPDLALFDHAGPARAARSLPGVLRPPYAVFVHGVEIAEQARDSYTRALRSARLLIANSYYTRDRARTHDPTLPPIEVCWPGMPAVALPQNGQGPSPVDVGFHALLIVGRMAAEQRHKGHDHVIACMPEILRRVPDARLIVAGGGDDLARLRREADDSGVGGHVDFVGNVNDADLHRLYDECAAFVMPSVGDGFGFVYLEAMSHRKPCIGLAGSAAAEIIEHGVTGLLVDRDNTPEMAAAIAGLLLDPARREDLGNAGYERLHSKFLSRHFGERFEAILKGLL